MGSLLADVRAEAILSRLREQDERQSSSMKEHVGSQLGSDAISMTLIHPDEPGFE